MEYFVPAITGMQNLSDVIEISVFGSGYGECIVIGVNPSHWIIVDSFLDENKHPIAMSYLEKKGVTQDSVKLIIASHWHEDHVKGFAQLAQHYSSAKICISGALLEKDYLAYHYAACDEKISGLNRTSIELVNLLELIKQEPRKSLRLLPCWQNTEITNDNNVYIKALSPLSSVQIDINAAIGQAIQERAPLTEPFSCNNTCVALYCKFGEIEFIFGSDLENEHGWSTIAEHEDFAYLKKGKNVFFKVPHHGSENSIHDGILSHCFNKSSYFAVTPYNKGRNPLPTNEMIEKLKNYTNFLLCASTPKVDRAKMESGSLNKMVTEIYQVKETRGHIRISINVLLPKIGFELAGAAIQL